MPLKSHKIISFGAVLAFISVLLGAFGAHAIRGKIGYDLFEIYQTGTQYLTIHALALILYGLFVRGNDIKKIWPAYAFLFGIFIFSGTLYIITFTAIKAFGAVTPIGGLSLMVGWIGFAVQAGKKSS